MPSCLSPNLLRLLIGERSGCLVPLAAGDLVQRGLALPDLRHRPRADLPERDAHPAEPISTVPFPLNSTGGTGTALPRDQSSRRQPAAVPLQQPTRSSDSNTSPEHSLLTATMSCSFARVSTMPCRPSSPAINTGVSHTRQWQGSIAAAGRGRFVPGAYGIIAVSSARMPAFRAVQHSPFVSLPLNPLWGARTAGSLGFSLGKRPRSFDHIGSSRSAKCPACGIRPWQNQCHDSMSWSTYTA